MQIGKSLRAIAVFGFGVAMGFVAKRDDNAHAEFGKLGLPINCRAYVQVAVDGFRARQYDANETMNGLERNCGSVGQIWSDRR